MVLLFIGPSGSGKDTQAMLLKEKYNFEVISTGDLLRDVSSGDSEIQNRIKDDMNEGFSPDGLVFGLLQICLRQSSLERFILTGAVRRISQIAMLDKALEEIGKKLDKVVYFELNNEEAVKRIKGRVIDPQTGKIYHTDFNPPPQEVSNNVIKRPDDKVVDSYIRRLDDFYRENENILASYKIRNQLVTIDAADTIESIHNELIDILGLNKQ